jgi:hypothetical protein
MPIRQVNAITVISQLIITLIILQGCGKVIMINTAPIISPNPQEKINMDVVFVHANKLLDFSYKYQFPGGVNPNDVYLDKFFYDEDFKEEKFYRYNSSAPGYRIAKINNILVKNAEIVLKTIFNDATTLHIQGDDHFTGMILDHQPYKKLVSPNTVGIIKLQSPEVKVFYACKKPEITNSSCNYANELTAQWILEDLDGNEIWSSNIVGFGIEDFAVFDSLSTKAGKPLQLAIDEHFRNLADALEGAPEIRVFESCLQVDCNSLLTDPSLLYETLNKIENIQERKQIAHRLIYKAIEKGNIDLLNEFLSTKYIDVNQIEEYYQVLPIHMAAKSNNIKAVNLLITNNSDINAGDNKGWTPLHYAAYNGFTEITELLIQKGADIDAKNNDAQTPFVLAITYGHKKDWQLLIDNGANYYAIDEDDLLGTALLYYKIGSYFAEKNDKINSTATLKVASEYFDRASTLYDDISQKAGSLALSKEIFTVALLAFNEWGSQYQARQQTKQYAEFKALNDASKMGLSQIQTLNLVHDYKHKYINSDAAMTVGNNMVSSNSAKTTTLSNLAKTTTLRDIKNKYSKLSEKCSGTSNEIISVLKCNRKKGIQIKKCIESSQLK